MSIALTVVLLSAVLAAVGFVVSRVVVSPALRAVCRRTFAGYFSGVLGYLIVTAFTVAASLTAFNVTFFARTSPRWINSPPGSRFCCCFWPRRSR